MKTFVREVLAVVVGVAMLAAPVATMAAPRETMTVPMTRGERWTSGAIGTVMAGVGGGAAGVAGVALVTGGAIAGIVAAPVVVTAGIAIVGTGLAIWGVTKIVKAIQGKKTVAAPTRVPGPVPGGIPGLETGRDHGETIPGNTGGGAPRDLPPFEGGINVPRDTNTNTVPTTQPRLPSDIRIPGRNGAGQPR